MKAEPSLHNVTIFRADLHDAAQCARINSFVNSHDDATLFHRPEWLRAVEKGCGQEAFYLIAQDAGGAICGLLPLTMMAHPLFGRALVSTGFGMEGGIVASRPAAANGLADEAQNLARRWSISSVELRGGAEHLPADWQIISDSHVTYALGLAADDEAQLTAIKKRQRAEIRRGLSHELSFETGNCDALADMHYQLYAESVRNLGTPVFPRSLFQAMRAEFGEDVQYALVRSPQGEPLVAVMSFYHKATVMPYWGGGGQNARHWRANEVIYYKLMCHARASRGCTRFDFGRSKVGSGSGAFKKNWGVEAQSLRYGIWSADGKSRDISPESAQYRLMIAAWKKLPLPVANRIGPWLSRGLG